MKTTIWQKLWEAFKEPLRYIILGLVTTVVDYVITNLAGTSLSPETIIIVTLILRGVDKFVYEYQKQNTKGSVEGYRGLTGI